MSPKSVSVKMARMGELGYIVLLLLGILWTIEADSKRTIRQDLQFCPFFNNRAPSPQPSLNNCTWFKENSCCQQQEIAATFSKMKPLPGASQRCQQHINHLMCYVCSPNQHLFYKKERLTVCMDFCEVLLDACRDAILKGSKIGSLYHTGDEFCRSRGFLVNTSANGACFTYDKTIDKSASSQVSPNFFLVISTFLLCYLAWDDIGIGIGQWFSGDLCKSTKSSSSARKINGIDRRRRRKASLRTNNTTVLNTKPAAGMTSNINRTKWLIGIVVCALSLPSAASGVESSEVKSWAELISRNLAQVAREGLKDEELQQFFDGAQYTVENVQGLSKLYQLASKLGQYTILSMS